MGPLLRQLRYARRADAATAFVRLRRRGEADRPGQGDAVLLVPFRVSPAAQWFEGVLSYSLRLRGFRPVTVLCNQAVNRCEQFVMTERASLACALCGAEQRAYVKGFDLEPAWVDALVPRDDRLRLRQAVQDIALDEISSHMHRGVAVGRQTMGSLSRFLLRAEVDLARNEALAREYLFTAVVSVDAALAAVARFHPRLAILSHGIYATWGSVLDALRIARVPVVVWGMQYRKYCFLLAHNRTYHRDVVEEDADVWESLSLSESQKSSVLDYLDQRGRGPSPADFISYYRDETRSVDHARQELGLEPNRTRIGLFPNLSWDAQIVYGQPVFRSMSEWIVETVRWFDAHADRDLVIRAHPAEVRGAFVTQETVSDVLGQAFPSLPPNVRYVSPDSAITSYQVAELVHGATVYGTKFGLELVLRRKPVLVAGDAYYRGKGFTLDATSRDQYLGLLGAMPRETPVTEAAYERALRYAFHYNFRRMFPIPLAELQGTAFERFIFDDVRELEPGRNPHLDDFFARCFSGRPFEYDGDLPEHPRSRT